MKIWSLTTQKGGAGKSTLAVNLAVAGERAGEKVLLIDMDEQASAAHWWESREGENPFLIQIKSKDLPEALKKAKDKGFSLVIIDTAGRDTMQNNPAILNASFCLVPCQPSLADMRAAQPTIQTLKQAQKNFAFILTRCPSVGQDGEKARKGLAAQGLVCLPVTHERKAYKLAYASGEGVMEFEPVGKATDEIKAIFKWIKNKEEKLGHEF